MELCHSCIRSGDDRPLAPEFPPVAEPRPVASGKVWCFSFSEGGASRQTYSNTSTRKGIMFDHVINPKKIANSLSEPISIY